MKQLLHDTKVAVIALAFAFGLAVLPLSPAFAATAGGASGSAKNEVCTGVNGGAGGCTGGGAELQNVVKAAVSILSVIAGVAAVIMLVIGGLKYVTSGGDAGSVASAKNTITYALVGLVVVALAQAVVKFVLGKATATGGGAGQ